MHWDGRIVPGDAESLAVFVFGAPSYTEVKLLGVPVISDCTGATLASTNFELVQQWTIASTVVVLVFDITASNFYPKNRASVILE